MKQTIKAYITMLLVAFTMIFLPLTLWAQELPVVSDVDFILYLITSLGGINGVKGIALGYIIAQLLFKFVATPLANKIFGEYLS